MSSDDERQLLASLEASIHDQDSYEDNVIRQATLGLAPTLTGVSFPPLDSLAPSYSAKDDAGQNSSDLPHVHALLSRVRQQIQGRKSEDETEDKLYLKEQMLLSFLSSVSGVRDDELPGRRSQERAAELKRSQALREQFERKPPATTNGDVDKVGARASLRQRVPMMKRKRSMEQEGSEGASSYTLEHREKLKKMRQERKLRKKKRREALLEIIGDDEEESSEGEAEFDGDLVDTSDEALSSEKSRTTSASATELDSTPCPLCGESVLARAGVDIDETLSRHMDRCQRSTSRPRRGLGSSRPSESAWPSTGHPSSDRPQTSKKRKKPRKTKRPRPNTVRTLESIDDLQEIDYEDRVDDWIENGLSRMKEMKERDEEDVPPGAQDLPDGLQIPAWMNDRLFGYQREALAWMWNLHRQGSGGVLGDEMGTLRWDLPRFDHLVVFLTSKRLRAVELQD